jgi:hypothetical protein
MLGSLLKTKNMNRGSIEHGQKKSTKSNQIKSTSNTCQKFPVHNSQTSIKDVQESIMISDFKALGDGEIGKDVFYIIALWGNG